MYWLGLFTSVLGKQNLSLIEALGIIFQIDLLNRSLLGNTYGLETVRC